MLHKRFVDRPQAGPLKLFTNYLDDRTFVQLNVIHSPLFWQNIHVGVTLVRWPQQIDNILKFQKEIKANRKCQTPCYTTDL